MREYFYSAQMILYSRFTQTFRFLQLAWMAWHGDANVGPEVEAASDDDCILYKQTVYILKRDTALELWDDLLAELDLCQVEDR